MDCRLCRKILASSPKVATKEEIQNYLSIIGSLIYATHTCRADVAFAVSRSAFCSASARDLMPSTPRRPCASSRTCTRPPTLVSTTAKMRKARGLRRCQLRRRAATALDDRLHLQDGRKTDTMGIKLAKSYRNLDGRSRGARHRRKNKGGHLAPPARIEVPPDAIR